jgi:hypothetical protein
MVLLSTTCVVRMPLSEPEVFIDINAAAECRYSYWLPEGGQAIDLIAAYPVCKS